MHVPLLLALLVATKALNINLDNCIYKGEILPVGQMRPLAEKCAWVVCSRATINNQEIASLDVVESHPGHGCCTGPDGSMIQDEGNTTLPSGVEVSCCKGRWMQRVHLDIVDGPTEKLKLATDADVVLLSGGRNGINKSMVSSVEVFGRDGCVLPDLSQKLPKERVWHTSHYINKQILFVGGIGQNDPFPYNETSTSVLELLNGRFHNHSQLTLERFGHTGVIVDNQLILMGTNGAPNNPNGRTTEILTGQIWKTGKNADHRAAASCTVALDNNTALIIGDHDLTKVSIFDGESWTERSSLPGRRIGHSCALLQNGNVLVSGGVDNGKHQLLKNIRILNTALVYQRHSDTWVELPARMNFPRVYGQMVTLNGRILFFGGMISLEDHTGTDTIEEFKEDTGTWELLDAVMDQPKYGFSAVVVPAFAVGC